MILLKVLFIEIQTDKVLNSQRNVLISLNKIFSNIIFLLNAVITQ